MNLTKNDTYNQIIKNPRVRKEITRQSHYWFFHTYLNHYVRYQTAQFHKEIFALTRSNPKYGTNNAFWIGQAIAECARDKTLDTKIRLENVAGKVMLAQVVSK
jgi:hypothetical protein